MPEYDFKSLSPYDFEILCRDLLQRELGVRLQSFKTGRDNGIDLRYAPAHDNSLIVQCKHFADSSFSTLLSRLKRTEVQKVRKLAPSRYLFVTSLGLTPGNVDAILSAFTPYCTSCQDIYGQQDLNNLLTKYPDVEKAHFKLWLTSTSVLERVMHNAIFVQSELEREEMHNKLKVYVEASSLPQAAEILKTTHVCIVSGIPGIGKTTLAQIMLTNYLMEDWEIVTVRQNVREALDRFSSDPKTRQVFWYDDFLGQVALGEKLAKNEDQVLVQFMASVARHPNRRFILTTREYILKQAQQQHEVLSRADLDPHKHVLLLSDYSREQKAHILLNHLYFYAVPTEHIDALLRDGTYLQIIDHSNYSRRIIEWFTDTSRTTQCSPDEYPSRFIATLDDPVSLWKHAFENQISETSRHLLLMLLSVGQEVVLELLASAFDSFRTHCSRRYNFSLSPEDLPRSLRELEGTFVAIKKYKNATTVALHNPSIADFLVHYLERNPQYVADILQAALYHAQVFRTINLLVRGELTQEGFAPLEQHSEDMAGAVQRTLESPSIRFWTCDAGLGLHHLYMHTQYVFRRLQRCVELADCLIIPSFREFTLQSLRSYVAEVDVSKPNRRHLVMLFDAMEAAAWFPEDALTALLLELKGYLLDTPDAWEELCPVADWIIKETSWIEDTDIERYRDTVYEFVSHEAYELAEDAESPDTVEELQDDLRTISETLRMDFQDDIAALEEYRADLGQPEEHYDPDVGYVRSTGDQGCQMSIEAMFDSLRE